MGLDRFPFSHNEAEEVRGVMVIMAMKTIGAYSVLSMCQAQCFTFMTVL